MIQYRMVDFVQNLHMTTTKHALETYQNNRRCCTQNKWTSDQKSYLPD